MKVLSKDNLNEAYKQVIRNKGASGIDEMTYEEVKDYLKVNGDKLINQILNREYQPFPVRRVEISKPNGGIRNLGVPTVVDRMLELINEGYEWIVDLDLEKFFNNVPHDKLIRIIDNEVKGRSERFNVLQKRIPIRFTFLCLTKSNYKVSIKEKRSYRPLRVLS